LKGSGELDTLAALKRLDVSRANEVMAVFMWITKSVEKNLVGDFDIFSVTGTIINLEPGPANKHTEILVQAASERLHEHWI
jgi:hypothetical protein